MKLSRRNFNLQYQWVRRILSCEPSKKTFFKLQLIEKPVMRQTECRKPHQKFKIVTKLGRFQNLII